MKSKLPDFLLAPEKESHFPGLKRGKNLTFIDSTIRNAAHVMKSIYVQADISNNKNLLFTLSPYLKVISLIYLLIINSIVHNFISLVAIFLFIFILYILSGINVFQIYRKILFLGFFFGFLILLPATLNVITPGKIILNLISFDKPYRFWIYHLPQNIGVTSNGCKVLINLFLKILNSISFTLFICFTTSFPQLIKSFKILGIPDTFLMVITLAYKFIFILSQTIEDTYFALKSRLIGFISNQSIKKLIAERIFFIYKKSHNTYEQTYMAMVSRGYEGKILLVPVKKFDFSDIISLFILVTFGIFVLFI